MAWPTKVGVTSRANGIWSSNGTKTVTSFGSVGGLFRLNVNLPASPMLAIRMKVFGHGRAIVGLVAEIALVVG